jgi:hypothetical protein
MGYITIFLQIVVALGLLNVWLIRYNRETPYRGCGACCLKDEFTAYGLPKWFFYSIGIIKIGSAVLLLLGIWFTSLVFPTAIVVSLLMIGAIWMHLKVKDPFKKSIPAFIMLLLSIGICIGSFYPMY